MATTESSGASSPYSITHGQASIEQRLVLKGQTGHISRVLCRVVAAINTPLAAGHTPPQRHPPQRFTGRVIKAVIRVHLDHRQSSTKDRSKVHALVSLPASR